MEYNRRTSISGSDHRHLNKSILDEITEAFTTALKNIYDATAEAVEQTGYFLN